MLLILCECRKKIKMIFTLVRWTENMRFFFERFSTATNFGFWVHNLKWIHFDVRTYLIDIDFVVTEYDGKCFDVSPSTLFFCSVGWIIATEKMRFFFGFLWENVILCSPSVRSGRFHRMWNQCVWDGAKDVCNLIFSPIKSIFAVFFRSTYGEP